MARKTLSPVPRALIVALYLTVTLKHQAGTPSEQMSTGNMHNTRSTGSRSLSAAALASGTLGSAAQEPEEAVEESRPDDDTAYTIACPVCLDNYDDGRHCTWVQCDVCDIWAHGYCVGLWTLRACREATYICVNCGLACEGSADDSSSRSSRRAKPRSSGRKQCTPFCRPPGCVMGKGCRSGMGKLGEIENQRIYELVVKEADTMAAYLEGPEKDGEVGVWECNDGWAVVCTVIEWGDIDALVEFVNSKEQTIKALVPCGNVLRFAPGFTSVELDKFAELCGCVRAGKKQLLYEMRNVRREFSVRKPAGPHAYVSALAAEKAKESESGPAAAGTLAAAE